MESAAKFKLIVYDRRINASASNRSLVSPYSGQVIPGIDLPDEIESDVHFPPGSKYVVTVNSDATSIIEVLHVYPDNVWLANEIEEVNKYNRYVVENSGKQQRSVIAKPANLFMNDMKWEFLLTTVELDLYPLITGPTGCGKTVASRAVAEALGMQFYAINCGSLFKPKASLVGTVQAQEGSTFLYESEFLQYFKSDKPTIIYLDEISRIPSAAGNMLFPVLDREQNYMYVEEKSERIYKGDGVKFIAAANFGASYVDARKLDEAFLNRFIPVHLDYLPSEEEEKLILQRVPTAKRSDVSKLVRIANLLRGAKDSLGQEVSHRHMIDASKYLTKGFTVLDILDNIIVNLFVNGSDDRREVADKIIKSAI